MFTEFSVNQLLFLVVFLGAGFVIYRVFSDEKGAHHNRPEEGFDIFDRF